VALTVLAVLAGKEAPAYGEAATAVILVVLNGAAMLLACVTVSTPIIVPGERKYVGVLRVKAAMEWKVNANDC
jgi:hypothetical protein